GPASVAPKGSGGVVYSSRAPGAVGCPHCSVSLPLSVDGSDVSAPAPLRYQGVYRETGGYWAALIHRLVPCSAKCMGVLVCWIPVLMPFSQVSNHSSTIPSSRPPPCPQSPTMI